MRESDEVTDVIFKLIFKLIEFNLIKWAGLSVIVPLFPLAFVYIQSWLAGSSVSIAEVIARGGLLLLAVGLSFGAIAEIAFVRQPQFDRLKIAALVVCFGSSFFAAAIYSWVFDKHTIALQAGSDLPASFVSGVAVASIILYVLGVIAGGACVAVAAAVENSAEPEPVEKSAEAEAVGHETEEIVKQVVQQELARERKTREERDQSE